MMPIQDKELNELVAAQTKLFIDEAQEKDKIEILKKIQKRQKVLMKKKDD